MSEASKQLLIMDDQQARHRAETERGAPTLAGRAMALAARMQYGGLERIPHTSTHGPRTSQDAGDEHTDSGRRAKNLGACLMLVYERPNHGARWHFEWLVRNAAGERYFPWYNWTGPADRILSYALLMQEIKRRLYDAFDLDFMERSKSRLPPHNEYAFKITGTGLMKLETMRRAGR